MNTLVTPYRTVEHDEANSLIINIWTENTKDLTDQTLKHDFRVYVAEVIQKCKPRLVFHDVTDFQFTIIPELQQWIDTEVNAPAVKLGMEKVAFVVSKDIFSQVSIEQTMDEGGIGEVAVRYFDSQEEALNWLKS